MAFYFSILSQACLCLFAAAGAVGGAVGALQQGQQASTSGNMAPMLLGPGPTGVCSAPTRGRKNLVSYC